MKLLSKNIFVAIMCGAILSACQSTPTPKPRYTPDIVLAPSTVLEVLPQRASCNSSSPMQCLLVKQDGDTDGGIFGIGYRDIIGFDAKTGIRYKIKVRQEIDKNTNQPTGYWQLEEILSQNIAY